MIFLYICCYYCSQILKFGRTNGMPDSSDFVLYGTSQLRTGALTPAGEKISIGCLVKIEMNVQAGAIRMTTRTVHQAASSAMIQTAKTLIV